MNWNTAVPGKSFKNKQKPVHEVMNVRADGDKSIPAKWAIVHIKTGHFMPEPQGYNKNGSSFWNHLLGQAQEVRLFKSERAAKIALSKWLLGKHMPEWDDGFCYVGDIIPVADRKAEEMQVVQMDLTPRYK